MEWKIDPNTGELVQVSNKVPSGLQDGNLFTSTMMNSVGGTNKTIANTASPSNTFVSPYGSIEDIVKSQKSTTASTTNPYTLEGMINRGVGSTGTELGLASTTGVGGAYENYLKTLTENAKNAGKMTGADVAQIGLGLGSLWSGYKAQKAAQANADRDYGLNRERLDMAKADLGVEYGDDGRMSTNKGRTRNALSSAFA